MLQASIIHLFSAYGIKSGRLVIDDSDKERSKNTTEIAKVHKIKNKKSGGYFNGQNLIIRRRNSGINFLILDSKNNLLCGR